MTAVRQPIDEGHYIVVKIGNKPVRALVDTGSTQMLVSKHITGRFHLPWLAFENQKYAI